MALHQSSVILRVEELLNEGVLQHLLSSQPLLWVVSQELGNQVEC